MQQLAVQRMAVVDAAVLVEAVAVVATVTMITVRRAGGRAREKLEQPAEVLVGEGELAVVEVLLGRRRSWTSPGWAT